MTADGRHDGLAKVLAAPWDDGARLSYASELSERGDPRGRFIRLQVWRVTGIGLSPDTSKVEALMEEHRLLEQWRGRWLEDDVALVAGEHEFFRGFASRAALPLDTFLRDGAALLRRTPLRHLDTGARGSALRTLLSSGLADGLLSLGLRGSGLTDDDAATLAAWLPSSRIRWLDLAGNPIGVAGVDALAAAGAKMPLVWVDLSGNPADPRERPATWDSWGLPAHLEAPPELARIEDRHGPVPWLHVQYDVAGSYPPNRMREELRETRERAGGSPPGGGA